MWPSEYVSKSSQPRIVDSRWDFSNLSRCRGMHGKIVPLPKGWKCCRLVCVPGLSLDAETTI